MHVNGAVHAPSGEFIVYRFFKDGTYECVAKFVDPDEALMAVFKCMQDWSRPSVKVTITDSSDRTWAEWDRSDPRMQRGGDHGDES